METQSKIEKLFNPAPVPVRSDTGQPALNWLPRPEFGDYLRQAREDAELSLRQAARELGITFTRLQKMETGGRYRPPSVEVLNRVAVLYRVPLADLLRQAGFESRDSEKIEEARDPELEFESLAFHPELKPIGMDREWVLAYAPRIKEQWVEFACKLEALFHREPECMDRIMDAQAKYVPSPPQEADPDAVRLWTLEQMLRSGALLVTEQPADVGRFLRNLRQQKGVTIQSAARDLGMSYGTLHRLEAGDRPLGSIDELRPIVAYYGLELEETLRQLGVDESAIKVLYKQETLNAEFLAMMEPPELRPMGMTPNWMEKISAAQKRHWVDFAQNLVSHLEAGGAGVKQIVDDYRSLRRVGQRGTNT